MAKILIVGINYRPETTGIAPYTTDVAEHLAAAGNDTIVITGFPHYPSWKVEPGTYRLWTTEMLNGVRVLRRRHYVPRSQSAIRRALYEGTFLLNGALAGTGRPDLVIGVIPSLGGGILARGFAARARAPYALIFQDLMAPAARQSGIEGGTTVAGVTARLEQWAVARATTVGVASENFRPYLQGLGVDDDRIVSLPNWSHEHPPSADRSATRDALGWAPDRTVVLHAGNMGLKQGLGQVVEAARRADELAAPVLFVLMGEGSQRSALEAEGYGIERLQFLPFQPEERVADMLDAADVLLVSERASVIDMSLPSKLTAYFAAGRPIVAAVPTDGATAAEIERSCAGVIVPVGQADGLIEAVVALRDDAWRAAALAEAGRRYATSALDQPTAMLRIDRLVGQALGGRSTEHRRPAAAGQEPAWSFDLLGVEVNGAPFRDVLRRALAAPVTGERLSLHFATAHTLVEAHDSQRMHAALRAGTVEPDGMPLVWLGRRQGVPVERVCGPDFMPALIEAGIAAGWTHFFYGGAPGVPEVLASRLAARYPGLKVVGTLSPPFHALSEDEEATMIDTINAAAPDFLWVGLGTPKQDLWVAEHRDQVRAPVVLAVGAAFDFHAGLRRRAPRWMQRSGMEWLFRLAVEPRRLGSRYTRVNARFLRLVIDAGDAPRTGR
ncbi:MAG: WecB/TagA/CpsF family glycosyltransferase [Chloroflexi bacterium]|nr:WecB/TagA/CpsF family glycosyltransferase [Chloroflexota bacterium]